MLQMNDVRLEYPQFRLQIDMRISEHVTGIFGPSGSGKTTLLELIAGIKTPDTGRIEINNRTVMDSRKRIHIPPEKRRLGYVPQDLALFPHMNVEENIFYSPSGQSSRTEMSEIISILELENLFERKADRLSGGEKQRVAICRALLSAPQMLLLDEPLGSLDESLKERTLDYFRRVIKKLEIPVVYVSHEADEIVSLCTEVVVLQAGRVVAQKRATEVFEPDSRVHYRLRNDSIAGRD